MIERGRGDYPGWSRGFVGPEGDKVEMYYTARWGRICYVEAVLVDILDEDRATRFLQTSLVKMLAETGAPTA